MTEPQTGPASPAAEPATGALAMFEGLLAATWAGVGFLDRDLRYVRVNRQLALLNGVPAEAHIGRTVDEVIPAIAAEVSPLLRRVFETGEPLRDRTIQRPDPAGGRPVHLLVTIFPVWLAPGEVGWAGVVINNVTERERAIRALRQSEERFRLAARAARDVVWDWDLAGDTITTVGGAARVLGYGSEEAGDRPGWWITQIHPDDRDRVVASINAAIERAEFWSEEYRHRRADGDYAIVVDRAYLVRDESGHATRMVGVTTDVTLERTAAQILAASEARFRSVFESPMIGIGFRGEGRVWEANDALLDLLGYTRADLEAGMIDIEGLDDVTTPCETELRRKDGTRIPVLAGGSPYVAPPVTGVFFVLDGSELRRMREQTQAAQRMEVVGQLAGGVAHEVNNALQGVIGFSDFVLRSLATGVVNRNDVEQIRYSAERAARITQQLLAFSRRQLLRPMVFDLNVAVAEFLPMLRQALGPTSELGVATAPAPVLVAADRNQLEQVMLNIVYNARDAMPDGGRLTVRVGVAELGTEELAGVADAPPPGRYGMLELTDTGAGMEERVRMRVFEPFFTTKRLGGGNGLGLAVVYGIVRQSGGLVTCESAPGAGTTFRVYLPLAAGGGVRAD